MAEPSRTAVAAAIVRASREAQAAMVRLDAATVDRLTEVYREASEQLRAAIEAAAGNGSSVRLEAMRGLLARVDAVLQGLASAQDGVLQEAIQQAVVLGVQPLTEVDLGAGGLPAAAGHGVLTPQEALRQVDEGVRFITHFRDVGGLSLTDRLWRVERGARDAVGGVIQQAVVQGWSADRAAQELLMRGQPVPAATEAARRAADVSRVLRAADVLHDGAGGDGGDQATALANVLRVMRTEVNRAHGEAYMSSAAQAPGFVGFQFLLSPRHPRADVCDLLARQNLHGLGAGVYPDRKSCPWPAHPNTLSFVVARFAHQVTDEDRGGRETTLEALERLGPEIRAGVLGPTKASYFDQGLLRTGMVRATVGAVRARLTRQG